MSQVTNSPPSLFILPSELITMIMEDILDDLVDAAITDQYPRVSLLPIQVLTQYRSLSLTCKTFHQFVTDYDWSISMSSGERGFQIWWGEELAALFLTHKIV